MHEIDYTETDEFADSVIDSLYPQAAEAVCKDGGLLYGFVRTRRISPGPMARREYARANRLAAKNAKLRAEKNTSTDLEIAQTVVQSLTPELTTIKTTMEATKASAHSAQVAAEGAKEVAEKIAKKPTTVINAQEGGIVTVTRPPRADKGTTHAKTARGWKKQREMADDFSRYAKKIRGKWYGRMTLEKVKDWETRYPDEMHREPKSGYHAMMRRDPNLKTEYWKAARTWNEYWEAFCIQYRKHLETDPGCPVAQFRRIHFKPPRVECATVRRNDTDKTMRYGADTSLSDSLDNGDFDTET